MGGPIVELGSLRSQFEYSIIPWGLPRENDLKKRRDSNILLKFKHTISRRSIRE